MWLFRTHSIPIVPVFGPTTTPNNKKRKESERDGVGSKNEKREKNYVRKNSFLAMQNENILTQVIYLWHQV